MEVSKLLLRYREGQRDFRQVSLRNANLAQAQLAFINLDQAELTGANFREAQLAGANLVRADLSNAVLVGANLLGANLLSARLVRANLEGALLSGADLRATNLKQARLRNASCVGIDLSGADLREANLTDVNLKDANLRGANLLNAKWDRADLEGAQLDGAIMPNGEYVVPEEEMPQPQSSNGSQAAPIDEFNFPTLEERIDDDLFERSFETLGADAAAEISAGASAGSAGSDTSGSQSSQPLFGDVDLDQPGSLFPPSPDAQPVSSGGLGSALEANASLSERIKSKLQAQNQYQFRRAVGQAYNNQCAITGSRIQVLLKPVIISEETETGKDHPSNGILLRSDLAILFSEHLITFDPDAQTVLLAPSLRESEYRIWGGKPLTLPSKESERPEPTLLERHRKACRWYQAEQLAKTRTPEVGGNPGTAPPTQLWRSALRNLLGRNKSTEAASTQQAEPTGMGPAAETPPSSPVSPASDPGSANTDAEIPTGWLTPNTPPRLSANVPEQGQTGGAIGSAPENQVFGALELTEDEAGSAAPPIESGPAGPADLNPLNTEPATGMAIGTSPSASEVPVFDPMETLRGSPEELGFDMARELAGLSGSGTDSSTDSSGTDASGTDASGANAAETPSSSADDRSPDAASDLNTAPDNRGADSSVASGQELAPAPSDPIYDDHPYFDAQAFVNQGYVPSVDRSAEQPAFSNPGSEPSTSGPLESEPTRFSPPSSSPSPHAPIALGDGAAAGAQDDRSDVTEQHDGPQDDGVPRDDAPEDSQAYVQPEPKSRAYSPYTSQAYSPYESETDDAYAAQTRYSPYGDSPIDTRTDYETQAYETQSYETQAYDAQAYESQAYDAQAYETQAYDAQAYETQAYGAQAYGAQAYESQAYDTQAYETQVYEQPLGYGAGDGAVSDDLPADWGTDAELSPDASVAIDSDDSNSDGHPVFQASLDPREPDPTWTVPPEPGAMDEAMPWVADLGTSALDASGTEITGGATTPAWEVDLAAAASGSGTSASSPDWGEPVVPSDRQDSIAPPAVTDDEISVGFPSAFGDLDLTPLEDSDTQPPVPEAVVPPATGEGLDRDPIDPIDAELWEEPTPLITAVPPADPAAEGGPTSTPGPESGPSLSSSVPSPTAPGGPPESAPGWAEQVEAIEPEDGPSSSGVLLDAEPDDAELDGAELDGAELDGAVSLDAESGEDTDLEQVGWI
ncbi:MAG: pentapeptide repeat-containing protein [Prochlorothrix sp.]